MVEAFIPLYPLNVGDLLDGKYRIDAILGEGGMGIVFAATHVELHCPVALKVIRQELSQEPELVSRLMLEARAAAQIKSEHVCRVLDVGRLGSGVPYVVMEYLRGKNLAALIRAEGRLPQQLAVDYLLQACEAVAEAHRAGVIHRDLKPENLFLAEFPDGHRAIKVLDFGISKTTGVAVQAAGHKLTNPSVAMGSPHYMAPEQMASAHDVDTRADIWALGAIFYEFLTGHLAFAGDSLPVVCAAVLQSSPVSIRHHHAAVPAELEQIIFGCLSKDREQRPSSIAMFAQQIAPYGSAKASESLSRIRRLLAAPELSGDVLSRRPTTLRSPNDLVTPPNMLQRNPPQRTPVETAAAVTSPKDAPRSSAAFVRQHRTRWVVAGSSVVVAIGCLLYLQLRRNEPMTGTQQPHLPREASSLPESAPVLSMQAPAEPVNPTPVVDAPSSAVPAEKSPSSVVPAEKSPSSAVPAEKSPSSVAPAEKSPSSAVPAEKSPSSVAPAEKSPPNERALVPRMPPLKSQLPSATTLAPRVSKTKNPPKSDPYDSDNFGGRR